jgi:hypothetical protein
VSLPKALLAIALIILAVGFLAWALKKPRNGGRNGKDPNNGWYDR